MTNKAKISGWDFYGSSRSKHGFLPERGIHYITGPDDDVNMAIAAELAVAVAAGDVGGGLSAPDENGVRHAKGGFFGQPIGGQGAVVVLTTRKDAMERAVEAAGLARGVTAPLPIAYAAPRNDAMARALAAGEFRLAVLRDALGDPALVIVDGLNAATRMRHDAVRGLTAVEEFFAAPVFVLAAEPLGVPSAHDSSALAVAGGVVTFRPASGEGWARKFAVERIRLLDGEANVVRPGEAADLAPKVTKAPKAAEQIVRGPNIVKRVVLALTGNSIGEAERARWPGHDFVTSVGGAVDAVQAASADGVTEIVIVASHRGGDVRAEAHRVMTALHSAGLTDFALVRVSDVQLLDPHAVAA